MVAPSFASVRHSTGTPRRCDMRPAIGGMSPMLWSLVPHPAIMESPTASIRMGRAAGSAPSPTCMPWRMPCGSSARVMCFLAHPASAPMAIVWNSPRRRCDVARRPCVFFGASWCAFFCSFFRVLSWVFFAMERSFHAMGCVNGVCLQVVFCGCVLRRSAFCNSLCSAMVWAI